MLAPEPRELAAKLVEVARKAGQIILSHYRSPFAVELKADASPVTAADRDAEAIILEALAEIAPGIAVVAEEAMAAAGPTAKPSPPPDRFFLVDPLDGTKEFINRRDQFTVNIALIERGEPTFGLVYAPALSRIYLTTDRSQAAEADLDAEAAPGSPLTFRPLACRPVDQNALTVVASRSHMNEETRRFLEQYKVASLQNAGSSLKFCLIARGEADFYPRLGPTMQWDTAAGHAVLAAAGGRVCELDGRPLRYGASADRGLLNPHFVAWGRRG